MAIARFENITVNTVVAGLSPLKQQTFTLTPQFVTTAQVIDTTSDFKITEDTRIYTDMTKFKLRNTPAIRDIAINNELYAITYRNRNWKVHDCLETNDRAWVIISCSSQLPAEAV